MGGENPGSEMRLHHIFRAHVALPHLVPDVSMVAVGEEIPPGDDVLAVMREFVDSMQMPVDLPALSNYQPPYCPPHFTEARAALSARVRSVYCPECEASPGQPCVGLRAFVGRVMTRHHNARAEAAIPGVLAFPILAGLEDAI
jgi:hypothetical protein